MVLQIKSKKQSNYKKKHSKLNKKNNLLRKYKNKIHIGGGALTFFTKYLYKLILVILKQNAFLNNLLNEEIKRIITGLGKNINKLTKETDKKKQIDDVKKHLQNLLIKIIQSCSILGFIASDKKDTYIQDKLTKILEKYKDKTNPIYILCNFYIGGYNTFVKSDIRRTGQGPGPGQGQGQGNQIQHPFTSLISGMASSINKNKDQQGQNMQLIGPEIGNDNDNAGQNLLNNFLNYNDTNLNTPFPLSEIEGYQDDNILNGDEIKDIEILVDNLPDTEGDFTLDDEIKGNIQTEIAKGENELQKILDNKAGYLDIGNEAGAQTPEAGVVNSEAGVETTEAGVVNSNEGVVNSEQGVQEVNTTLGPSGNNSEEIINNLANLNPNLGEQGKNSGPSGNNSGPSMNNSAVSGLPMNNSAVSGLPMNNSLVSEQSVNNSLVSGPSGNNSGPSMNNSAVSGSSMNNSAVSGPSMNNSAVSGPSMNTSVVSVNTSGTNSSGNTSGSSNNPSGGKRKLNKTSKHRHTKQNRKTNKNKNNNKNRNTKQKRKTKQNRNTKNYKK